MRFTSFFALVCVLCLSIQAYSQARKAPAKQPLLKRPVTVTTKQGQKINGHFLGANLDAVRVEDSAGPRSISLDDVASIRFTADVKEAREAIKALRGLISAVEIGVSYVEYSRRLIDAKIIIDGALSAIDEGEVKTAVAESLQFFEDAMNYWRGDVQSGVSELILSDKHIRQLIIKYGADVGLAVSSIPQSENKRVAVNKLVSAVMTAAARKTVEAELLLKN